MELMMEQVVVVDQEVEVELQHLQQEEQVIHRQLAHHKEILEEMEVHNIMVQEEVEHLQQEHQHQDLVENQVEQEQQIQLQIHQ
jgi:hypothetical protein